MSTDNQKKAEQVLKTFKVETRPAKNSDESIEVELFEKRSKIYPRKVTGKFAFYRKMGVYVLLGLFYLIAWISIDGQQIVLWDLPNRKFHVFGMVFWPQDFIYLALLLIFAAFLLFFITAIAGRVWCGYACPQTVWTELFLWLERKVEGDRAKQIKLDRSKGWHKIQKKVIKHVLWLVIALWTGFTFVGYFTPIRELFFKSISLSLSPWETFWVLFYGFATYGNAGWLREQICLYMCPYARFQSAMFDKDTLTISYNQQRGEPRGSRKKEANLAELNLGSCIDCTLCVQVCPTGIDIRNGLQYECIGCAACIDVCDDVMDKMGYPKGLISYTTENSLEGNKQKLWRPRVIIYSVILIALVFAAIIGLAKKAPADFEIRRDRGVMFREVGVSEVENVYTIHIINKTSRFHEYTISASGIDNIKVLNDVDKFALKAGEGNKFIIRLRANKKDILEKNTTVYFYLSSNNDSKINIKEDARFIAPFEE